jgi:hypothetical protein
MIADMNIFSRSHFHKLASALAILSASILFCGCEDIFPDQSAVKPRDPGEKLDFGIVIFDGDGNEGTSFRKGTDIQLALKLVTDGGKMFGWRKVDECGLYSRQDFLLVFKSNENLDTPPSLYYPLGTPFDKVPAFCSDLDVPPIWISGGTVILSSPWSSNPENEPLVAGRYYATATFDLIVDGEAKRWEIKHNFEIYN